MEKRDIDDKDDVQHKFITPKTVVTNRRVGPFLMEVAMSKVCTCKERKPSIVMQGAKH